MDDDRDGALATLAGWVRAASDVVVLTGAGMSTASGIPDFRGPQGVWTTAPDTQRLTSLPDYLADPDVRVASWAWRAGHPGLAAEPNAAHHALVRLERAGHVALVVTQNVDGLHGAAGSERLAEVHGSMRDVVCVDCAWRAPIATAFARIDAGEPDPRCPDCGGITKAGTVFFGESLPADAIGRALNAAASASLLLALGTTLEVYPVAALPDVTQDQGGRVAVVNRGATGFDHRADLVVDADLATFVPALGAAVLDDGGGREGDRAAEGDGDRASEGDGDRAAEGDGDRAAERAGRRDGGRGTAVTGRDDEVRR